MTSPAAEEQIARFVVELLHTGSWLSDLVADLSEGIAEEAYPGEEPRAVVIEMLCGTIASALQSADLDGVERATELIGLARARTLEHLRVARALSRRIHGDDGGVGRTHG